jgi:hypothetical protein
VESYQIGRSRSLLQTASHRFSENISLRCANKLCFKWNKKEIPSSFSGDSKINVSCKKTGAQKLFHFISMFFLPRKRQRAECGGGGGGGRNVASCKPSLRKLVGMFY